MRDKDSFPWILAAAYALVFSILGALRYAVFRNFVDFGIFAQTVASAFGCFCNTREGSHWAFHFSPILYAVGALDRVWHSPLTLVVIQAIACALTIPAIYALVARRASRGTARLAAIVVALYPALAGLTFDDFHENGFAPAAVAWTLWAFDGGLLLATAAFAALALSIKEDQAVFLGVAGLLGGWQYRWTRRGRLAIAVALASICIVLGFFLVIQPHAATAAHWAPTRFYSWSGKDLAGLPLGLLARAGFIVLLFLPLLFVPFRSAMMWLAAAPLAEVLLSRMSVTYTLGLHYAGAWLGYVLVAFAFAVREYSAERINKLLGICIALCVVEFLVADPLHPGMNLRAPQPRDAALSRFLSTLPRDVSLATQEEAYTHLALTDPNARLLPEQPAEVPDACFVLIDDAYPNSAILEEYGAAFQRVVRDGVYRLVRRDGQISLYRRVNACAK
ncbi:MAG: DUF2079 domain-containing protein [Vulcanimicrobiaceae bacterium]